MNPSINMKPFVKWAIIAPILASNLAQSQEAAIFRGGNDRAGVMESGPALQGRILWQQRVGNNKIPGIYGDLIMSSPAVAEDTVYFGSQNGFLYALEALTGKERWKFQTGGCIHSSPAVVHGIVFFGSHDKHVYALDARTGKEKWKFRTDGLVRSSPAVWMKEVYHEVWDGQVFVGSEDGHLYALHADNGKLQWRFKTDGPVFSSPSVGDGIVHVGSLDGHLYALDAKTGKEKWRFKTGYWITSVPTVREGRVYVSSWDGKLYALDAASGKKKWTFDTGMVLARHMTASPAVTEDLVLIAPQGFYQVGGSYLCALDIRNGKERWRHPVKGTVESSPVAYNGLILLVDSSGCISALELKTGRKDWECRINSGGGVASCPTVAGGRFFFGNHGGVITAVE
jgi:outer membrane protein assembly factor BamB